MTARCPSGQVAIPSNLDFYGVVGDVSVKVFTLEAWRAGNFWARGCRNDCLRSNLSKPSFVDPSDMFENAQPEAALGPKCLRWNVDDGNPGLNATNVLVGTPCVARAPSSRKSKPGRSLACPLQGPRG